MARINRRQMQALVGNHLDAWLVALTLSFLALVIHDAISTQTLALAAAIGLGYWLAFALNDYYDAPYDAADRAKAQRNYFVLAGAPRWPPLAFFVVIVLLAIVFAHFGPPGWLVMGLSLAVMWAYSSPPLRFKDRPGLDLLVHALFVESYPYLITLVLIGVVPGRLDWAILAITLLASLAAQLEQQLRDFSLEVAYSRNFVILAGRRRAHALLRLATLLLAVVTLLNFALGVFPPYLIPYGAIAAPILLHRLLRGRRQARSRWLALSSALLALLYTGAVLLYHLAGVRT